MLPPPQKIGFGAFVLTGSSSRGKRTNTQRQTKNTMDSGSGRSYKATITKLFYIFITYSSTLCAKALSVYICITYLVSILCARPATHSLGLFLFTFGRLPETSYHSSARAKRPGCCSCPEVSASKHFQPASKPRKKILAIQRQVWIYVFDASTGAPGG